MKNMIQPLLFLFAILLGTWPVSHTMDTESVGTPTLRNLPDELIRKIISHVPTGPSIKDRFKSVSTATECSKGIHTATTSLAFDPTKKLSKIQVQKLSKLYLATCEASDNEKETMLWEAVHDKNYTTISLLLEWYPHLINSCNPLTGNNSLASLLSNNSFDIPPLDLVTQFVETDKKVNKTKNSNLINARNNIMINIDRWYYVTFGLMDPMIGPKEGLSCMDILLYKLASPANWHAESGPSQNEKRQNHAKKLQQLVQYLIGQGGFFNTKTYCSEDFDRGPMLNIRIKCKEGANSTLGIIINFVVLRTHDPAFLDLFLSGSHLNINTHDITAGMNALHWAALNNTAEFLKYLLNIEGIDVNALSTEGKTPLDYLNNDNEFVPCLPLLQGKNAKTARQLKLDTGNDNAFPVVPNNDRVIGAQQPNLVPVAPAPVPGNNPPVVQHHWYKKSSPYWIARLAVCSALVYGVYRYFYPVSNTKEMDEDEQGTVQGSQYRADDLKVT